MVSLIHDPKCPVSTGNFYEFCKRLLSLAIMKRWRKSMEGEHSLGEPSGSPLREKYSFKSELV